MRRWERSQRRRARIEEAARIRARRASVRAVVSWEEPPRPILGWLGSRPHAIMIRVRKRRMWGRRIRKTTLPFFQAARNYLSWLYVPR